MKFRCERRGNKGIYYRYLQPVRKDVTVGIPEKYLLLPENQINQKRIPEKYLLLFLLCSHKQNQIHFPPWVEDTFHFPKTQIICSRYVNLFVIPSFRHSFHHSIFSSIFSPCKMNTSSCSFAISRFLVARFTFRLSLRLIRPYSTRDTNCRRDLDAPFSFTWIHWV